MQFVCKFTQKDLYCKLFRVSFNFINCFIHFFIYMNGEQLKHIIERSGLKTKDFAERLGISAQQLNNMFSNADVKSGTLEKVAEIMQVPIASLYGDFNFVNTQVKNNIGGDNIVELGGYDALKKRDEQIDRLLLIIERMQEK